MFVLKPTNQFKKDLKAVKKRSVKNESLIVEFLEKLIIGGADELDKKYIAHKLSGKYSNDWEAHVRPDLLIVWFEITSEQEILLLRVGSHSDLF
jgi:mRNA interferase YafQ